MDCSLYSLDALNNCKFENNDFHQPTKPTASYYTSGMNVISANSNLVFGSDILFDLVPAQYDEKLVIDDILLSIDIPILKPSEKVEYVESIGYKIFKSKSKPVHH